MEGDVRHSGTQALMMKNGAVRHMLISSAAVMLLAVAVPALLDRYGEKRRVFGARDVITSPAILKSLVDDPTDAYRAWKEHGYRGRTILYIADSWPSFRPNELNAATLSRPYPLQLFNPSLRHEQANLDGRTFLFVASKNGIARNIVAILSTDGFKRMKEAAGKTKDTRMVAAGLAITHEGFPRIFTTGSSFAGLDEPSLVYVGASYFRTAEPEELFRQLTSRGLVSDCMILCREKGNPTVTSAELSRLERFSQLIGHASTAAIPTVPPGLRREGRLISGCAS